MWVRDYGCSQFVGYEQNFPVQQQGIVDVCRTKGSAVFVACCFSSLWNRSLTLRLEQILQKVFLQEWGVKIREAVINPEGFAC